ncbi:hypothetical protein K432DRAFT_405909 [Lepidopterella palustris CBS 459.81]|uniref:Uncharacterized protein n=1 Tax=Lepidopterella palustris CBS 459.81 TaxID=1314670 RepID=A0A8E2JE60_9PEZI|nr:hypothetical protein K432DRAFT_405909 [Lepidopterella palustris CBS 459.81]
MHTTPFILLTTILTTLLPLLTHALPHIIGQPGGVYYCVGPSWTSDCGYTDDHPGHCHVLGNGFYANTASIGPNPMTRCRFWDNDCCDDKRGQLDSVTITYPGNADLSQVGWADRAKSFICELGD